MSSSGRRHDGQMRVQITQRRFGTERGICGTGILPVLARVIHHRVNMRLCLTQRG
jgi:hypothetical protein